MTVNQEALKELCVLINRRNELQAVRNSARGKISYYDNILRSMKAQREKKQLLKLSEKDTNPHYKKLMEMDKKTHNQFPSREVYFQFREFLHVHAKEVENQIADAANRLNNYHIYFDRKPPKKYAKCSLHYLKTLKQKYIVEYEQAKFDIMCFTQETTKEVRALLKKVGAKQVAKPSNYVELRVEDKFLNLKAIKEIAFNASIEEVLSE